MNITIIKLLPILVLLNACDSKVEEDVLVLSGGKVYTSPYEPPINKGAVVIKDGIIEDAGEVNAIKIPNNARVIDCSGLTITAGFWNSHVHFIGSQWNNADSIPAAQLELALQKMLLAFGFVYAFDLAALDQDQLNNVYDLKGRIESGEVRGPKIFTAGLPLCPPNGTPFYVSPLKLPEFQFRDSAIAHARKQIEGGADAIKLWSASPLTDRVVVMPTDIASSVVEYAHSKGKPVFAHPTDHRGVEVAIESGVDILSHTAPTGLKPWDGELINRMISKSLSLIPTISLFEWELQQIGAPADSHPLVNTALMQLRDFSRAGGDILFGTDVGYMPDYSPEKEYLFLQSAGLNYLDILESLTTSPAKKFGVAETTGMVRKGMRADFVILNADPREDVINFTSVKATIKDGRFIYGGSEF